MAKKKALSTGDKTVLVLSARGDCYNPDCNSPLITVRDGRPIVNFQIAHIRDELRPANENDDIGWRFWPADDMPQAERNHFSNLILLCKPCHALIDKIDPRSYSVSLLHEWKTANEEMRGKALAESLGTIQQNDLNRLIIDAFESFNMFANETERQRISQGNVDRILAEIDRYRRLIDQLLLDGNWVSLDVNGNTLSLSPMAHNVTFEIVADTSMPNYVRQAAIAARNMVGKGRHPSSPRKFADYLQRDLKWEANRLRKCLADGVDPFHGDEPSFDERNEHYNRALKLIDKDQTG